MLLSSIGIDFPIALSPSTVMSVVIRTNCFGQRHGCINRHVVENAKKYVVQNEVMLHAGDDINEFDRDNKHVGVKVFISKEVLMGTTSYFGSFKRNADGFICSILPKISHPQVHYSRGGLIFKVGGSNMQYVNYILGYNPLGMSYMIVYSACYPLRIHHKVNSLLSVLTQPAHIGCKVGSKHFLSPNANRNQLVRAVVGRPRALGNKERTQQEI